MKLNPLSKSILAVCLPAAVAVTLSACGSDSTATATNTITTTEYAGPGSKWDVTLNSDDSFEITRADSASDPVNMTVMGSYELLNSGFLKLTVSEASGSFGNLPSAGDVAYALDIPGYAFFLKPLDSGDDQVISMVKAGSCPTENVLANWVMVKSDGDTSSSSRDFFGTFSYDVGSNTPDLPTKYNLQDYNLVTGGGIAGSGSCADGVMNVTDATMYLTDNGGAIVHINSGTPSDEADDQFVFALDQKAIGTASTDGEYAGLLFDDSQSSGAKISPVDMSCSSNTCTATVLSDVETGATEPGSATIALTTFDDPEPGFARGSVSDGGSTPGNIACMVDTNAAGSGKKIVSCVGQSPGDNTKMFNVLFVSRS